MAHGSAWAGKSTPASHLEKALHQHQCSTYMLDGDHIRQGMCEDLGFSEGDRRENIRRVGEVAQLFADAGIIVIVAFISPFLADRNAVKARIGQQDFLEVHAEE